MIDQIDYIRIHRNKAKYVYISGPVTGLGYEEAKAAFDKAAREIKIKHGEAVVVVNPMDFCGKGEDWNFAMRKCIRQMLECDYIHMLPGYEQSKGAWLELVIAKALGFGVCNEQYELKDFGVSHL